MLIKDLFEATFNVDNVIDFIYNLAFSEFIENVQKFVNGGAKKGLSVKSRKIESDELLPYIKDEKLKETVKNNPVTIHVGDSIRKNEYSPITKEIWLAFNSTLYTALKVSSSFDDFMSSFDKVYHKSIMTELNGDKIKGSIAHELAHYFDDISHNNHLFKMMSKFNNLKKSDKIKDHDFKKIINQGGNRAGSTTYEIDAQIHDIKQQKRRYTQKEWDAMTFSDLMDIVPSVSEVRSALLWRNNGDKNEYNRWFRRLTSRLSREGLLGKNMKTYTF